MMNLLCKWAFSSTKTKVYMLRKAAITITIYNRYLRVRIIPKLPMFLAITLSSKEFRPNVLAYLTSLRHLAHLCTAYFVNPTKKGIITILIMPNISIPSIANRYPNKLVSYATIE